MAKYTDADALIADLLDLAEANKGTYHEEGFKNAITVVEDQPSADVVEVVRCKDCKYPLEDKVFGGLWCQHPTEKHCERNADFYCGSGERREE